MICVSIGRTRHKMLLAEIQEAARQGVELIELRLDFIPRALDFKRILDVKPCPYVATLRRQQDGGRYSGSEVQRLMLLRQIIASGQFEYVDLETDIAGEIRRFGRTKRIISYHNLKEMPPDLERIALTMTTQDPDIVKIAVRAEHPLDNLRVMELIKKAKAPTVAFCLGDMGVPSRILAGKYGAPFSYAAFNKERGIAPGILSWDEMRYLYHYDDINADTRIYAVLGDPIAHSLSPNVHNAGFRARGLNAVFLPFRVPRTDIESTVDGLKKVPVFGYAITIPHKEAVLNQAAHLDEQAERTRAVNTLVPDRHGKLAAYNTDCDAALYALRESMAEMPTGASLTGRTVLVLGAGGAARAVAYTLHQAGAVVTITSRNLQKAIALAGEIGCRSCDWTARNAVQTEIYVNCTPVGMHPNVDESPLHHSVFKPGIVVMDCVYNPETTLLVRQARDRGCRVVTGVAMFVHQAARQFELFTRQSPPVEVMLEAVRKAVSPVVHKFHEETDAA
jgi:3-dehydroquinate dehydratase/shikimate dehydrogenase